MRDPETIDVELRLLARAWRVAGEMGCKPSTVRIDELLDERKRAADAERRLCTGAGG